MATKRQKYFRKNFTKKLKREKNKKWVNAIQAASKTYNKTKSLLAAKKSFNKQALNNARKLFASVKFFN